MSFRSPTPDGLAIAPNAAGNVNNPAAQNVELQVHHYWGRYSLITQLPNVGTVDGVAVIGTNPASAPAYDKLAPGDLGFAQSTNRLYVCIDRGTVGGNDAVWESLNSAAVTQTVRDAHVIVVGDSGHLSALAGVAIPPLAANSLNLNGVTGDVLSVTVDYLDPGDGSELQNALAAAAAGGIPIDIRLRPCSITVTPAVIGVGNHAFVVPQGCRLIGAGSSSGFTTGLSNLTGTTGAAGSSQAVVRLDDFAEMEDVEIVSPGPTAAPGGAGILGVVDMAQGTRVRRCRVEVVGNAAFNRVQTAAIWSNNLDGNELVDDCFLSVDSLLTQPIPAVSYGVRWEAAAFVETLFDPEVRNTRVEGGCPTAVAIVNFEGGRVDNVQHIGAVAPTSSFAWAVGAVSGTPGSTHRGPQFSDCRTDATDDESTDQTGILIALGAIAFGSNVGPVRIEGYECRFRDNVNPNPNIRKDAIRISTSVTDTSSLVDTRISDVESIGQRRGIVVDGSGATTGVIASVRITNAIHRNSLFVAGALSGYGLQLRGAAAGNSNVRNVSAIGCDFSGAAAAGAICVYIENARVLDSQIGFCNARAGAGGVAITDNGTTSEIAHNII